MVVWFSEALTKGFTECRLVPDALGPMVVLVVDNPKVVFALGLTILRTEYFAKLSLADFGWAFLHTVWRKSRPRNNTIMMKYLAMILVLL